MKIEYYLIDVKSEIKVGTVHTAFDYINTCLHFEEAIEKAKEISMNPDVLDVSVHKWVLKEDGTNEHSEDNDSIPYHYVRQTTETETKTDWIPVSSGMYPADNENVQVTFLGYEDGKPYCDAFAYRKSGKWLWSIDGMNVKVTITAWKANCEPYMGK